MAARALLSRNGFAQEFRKVVGITPADFLTRVRITLAQRLLRKGRSVALVADDVGYGSQPAFSRAFIRETGVSPSTWVRTHAAVAP
jgi:AraC-like DNA-binding protein